MRKPLEWTDNHAYRDGANYHVYQDGKWKMALSIDTPNGPQQLGVYTLDTFNDAEQLAQALADQRG